MNLSATVYKPNRQHIPTSPTQPSAVRVAQADAKAHPAFPTQLTAVRVAQACVKAHSTLRHNRPQRLRPVGKPIHKQTSPRPKRRSTAQTSQTPDAAGKAPPKPARPQTPPAKHRPNQPDLRRRRQNAAQTRKTAPRIRRPKHPRQKAPKIKMGSGPDPDPIGSFQSDAAQLRLSFTATSMFSWQRPLFAVDILDQP